MEDELSRLDDEDHDLLTFIESGVRLNEELAIVRAALAESTGDAHDLLATRLASLEDALDRNSRTAEIAPGETGFLTYAPPPPA